MKKILVADDTADILHHLQEFLLMEGFEVVTAANGKEALVHLQSAIPDLIITDLLMPEMTGMELIKELKRDERLSRIPILVFSARPLDETLSLEDLGADCFVLKPGHVDILLKHIDELLNRKR